MNLRHDFKSYNARGRLIDCTWTESAVTYEVERAAYQIRLDQGELLWVEVHSSDPTERTVLLLPRQ